MRIVKNVARRTLSLLLAVIMVISLCPVIPMEAQAASGTLATNLLWSGDNWSAGDSTTLTGSVKSTSSSSCGNTSYTTKTATLTLKNNNAKAATLSFSWSSNNASAVSVAGQTATSGSYAPTELAAGAYITVSVTSHKSNTNETTLILKNVVLAVAGETYDVTFQTGENGSYKVGDAAITAERTDNDVDSGHEYKLTATPADGYKLAYWENANGEDISQDNPYTLKVAQDITVKPVFLKADTAMFEVGGKKFYDLKKADAYASSQSVKQINLIANGTNPQSNVLYPGDYTISKGNTLLIPFDDKNTCYREIPGNSGYGGSLLGGYTEVYETPSMYRTLTMASGANITVDNGGAISVSAKHTAGASVTNLSSHCGAVSGKFGQIQMDDGSNITVNGGGNLYAWGYITGSGLVTAKSGATVHELMQVTEFRGGNCLSKMSGNPDKYGNVFPLSQYYVQNIETKLKLEAGATEKGYTTVLVALAAAQSSNPEFIGNNGMFRLNSGYVIKSYDPGTDRLHLDIYGDVTLASLNVSMYTYNFDSSRYTLPLTNNLDITVNKGNVTMLQNVALLPGVKVTIKENASLEIGKDKNVYVYDSAEWVNGNYVHVGQDLAPVAYSPTRQGNPRVETIKDGLKYQNNKMSDAIVDVNGKVTVNGNLYTTASGAQIISSQGTGEIYFANKPGEARVTHQFLYVNGELKEGGDSVANITITPAKLLNKNGTYEETADDTETPPMSDDGKEAIGPTNVYFYDGAKWYKEVDITYNSNGGTGTLEKVYDVFYDDIEKSNSFSVLNRDIGMDRNVFMLPGFDGFDNPGFKAYAWNTNANGGTDGALFPEEDYTLGDTRYSAITFYAQWQENYVTVVLKDSDGKELKRFENQRADSPVNMLENVELPNLEKGFSRKWRPVVNGEEQELIDTLPAKFPKENTDYVHTPVAIPYEIKYELNGGTLSEGKVNPATYTIEDEITLFNPTREGYDFAGWTGTGIDGVSTDVTIPKGSTGDRTYTATWTVKQYKAIFNAGEGATFSDGSTTKEVLVNYGETPVAPENPSKFEHTFAGWSPVLAPMGVNGATYTATYDINKYTVTWVVDGKETEEEYEYGATPNFKGSTDKAADAQYTYTFAGWDEEIVAVTGEATYTATYNKTVNQYTVTFYDENGNELQSKKVAYGETPVYTGAEPTKAATAQYSYTFAGWTPEIAEVSGDATYTATYTPVVNKYTIKFVDEDGKTVLQSSEVEYGSTPTPPANPTKAATAQYSYTFNGWTPAIIVVAGEATYTATYTETLNKYTVTWVVDGKETEEEYEYGATPNFKGSTDKAADAQYTYTFDKWTPEIAEVTGDATYTATYTPVVNKYTVTWVVDGKVTKEEYEYGATPNFKGSTDKAADVKFTYTFVGWDEEIVAVTGEATYTATYNKTVNQYTVTFYDENGNELQSKKVAYGETPVYTGAEPTKAATAQYSYTFAGWTPEIAEVTGDATYTATYTPVVNKYTIKFVDEDGKTVLQSSEVEYGSTPTPPANPTKAATAQYSYTFNGWTPAIIAVAGEATYTATYTETVNEYTITFVNEDGTELQSSEVAYGETPVYAGADPTKAATAQYTYTFVGWDKEIVAVTGEATYTAQYSSTVNQYKVTFNAGIGAFADGGKTVETMVPYGEKPAEPEKPAKAGYTFVGWDSELKTVDENGATYTAVYTANDVGYTVETYIMGLDGVYGKAETEEKSATTDSKVSVEPEVKEGFTVASDSVLSGTVAADGNTVLKVYYSRNKYTIAFSVDGQSYTTRTHYYGAEINDMPNPPTKEGHTFVDWNPAVPTTMPAKDLEIKALWNVNQYTITFDSDGGSAVEAITLDYGTAVDKPADPIKEGYSFAGWVTRDSTGSETSYEVPDTMPAQNVTAYAKWTIEQYNISYQLDNGTVNGTNPTTYNVETADITLINPTKLGYTFAGWTGTGLDVASTNVTIAEGSTGDRTYTATWTPMDYKIEYVLNGGSLAEGVTNPESYNIETETFALNNPTRTGYIFAGWTGTGLDVASTNVTIAEGSTGDRTYTATWTAEKYTIEYVLGDDAYVNGTNKTEYTIETDAFDLINPTRTGYTFAGWEIDNENVGTTVTITKGSTGDRTYTATWTANKYEAVFNAGDGVFEGGLTSVTEMVDYATMPKAEKEPTKLGYKFAGWTPALAPMGVNGATYTAVYEAIDIKYTVETYTMDLDGNYGKSTTETKYGKTDTAVAETPAAEEGFTLDTANSVLEGKVAADGSLVLKVYYSRNQYDVIYKVDGNNYEEKTYFYGADVTALAAPTKEGYTFSGWSEIPTTMPAKDVTVTGTFTINNYTVTWKDENGVELGTDSVDHGSDADDIPSIPPKTGYTGSWNASSNNVTGNTTIQATYKPNNYSIGWFVDGEAYTWTEGEEQKTTTVVVYDTAITIPAVEPTKEGYTFQGWYTGENGTGLKITNETTYKFGENGDGIQAMSVMAEDVEISGNTALYAHFTINSYNVTWIVDDAKTEETYVYNAAIVKPADPQKTGYTFTGWSPAVPSTMPASNQTFTATWQINQYTITFANTGDTQIDDITADYQAPVTKPADPKKNGYTFAGWDKEIPATMPVDGMTITAKWTANKYTVTWNVDGKTSTSEQTYSLSLQLPVDVPEKDGYIFAGWFTEQVGGTQVTPDTKYEIAGDTTYYAHWEAREYEVTWVIDDACDVTTMQAYEAYIKLPQQPNKDGYTFKGWFTTETGDVQVTGETVYKTLGTSTYYAHWDETDYVITYTGLGDDGTHENQGGYSLDILPMTLSDAAKPNFVFMGWTSADLGITEPTIGLTIREGTIGDLALTAHFKKAYASVTSGSTTTYYLTLAEAVAAAQSGDTVKLLDSMTGAGMVVDKDITIDFGGNTYTFDISIGSTGTETLGFQLMVGKNVTLKSGELKADPTAVNAQGKVNKVLIQNYANLNLERMTLTANENTLYNLSINSGNVAIKDCTIEAALGKVAFDVCKYASYAAPVVTAENCTVTGVVEVTGGNLTVNGGTYKSNDTDVFVVDSGLLTINGNPSVIGGSKNQSTAVWAKNTGKVVINGGSFNVGADETAVDGYNDLIYARDNAVIEINGGTFDGPAKNGTSQKFLLNLKDGSNATIIVKGGTYIGFDPQDSGTEPAGAADDFTAEGFIAVNDGNGNFGVIAHTHAYTYKANGSVITESCFEGCRHQATAELELDASVSLVYTGSAIKPYKVITSDAWAGGDLAVAYENNVDAGTATAKISVDNATASETFTIAKAELTDVEVAQDDTLIYNESAQTPEVTTRATAVNGQKVTFTYGTEEGNYGAMPAFETVGTYTVYFKAVAPNHNAATGSFIVTVGQGTPAYTVPTGLTGAVGQTLAAVALPDGWSWNEAATELTVEGEQKFVATFTHENSNYKSVSVDVAVDVFMPTITFANTGDVAIEPIKQAYNTDVTAPTAPTKEGYSFIRWDKEIPAKMPAENVTINAEWKINQYTITFANTGDSKIDPIKQDYGTAVTAPKTPTKEGHTFAGWDVTIPATMPAGDMTITAQWTVNQYTITFANTGDSKIDPIKQDYGTAVTAPENPSKTGYSFGGWTPGVPETMPAKDMTVEAQWTINQYTITFDTDGGSEIAPIKGDYGTAVKRPSNPSKEGYTFAGWDVTIPATMPAENVTITAKWKVNQYTITFNTVGGTEIASITQDYGTAVTAPADPTKTGYNFAGWDVTIPETMPAGNMTITAQWTINQYTITFDTDGGNAIDAIVQNYNTAVTAPAAPKKTGYTFVGWDKEIPTTMPAENVTITAQWKINQYTITFNTEGGTAVAAIKQDYGTAVTAPADPTKTGYDFSGWDVKIPATMPAENVTITAKWTINSYTITFDTAGGTAIVPITQDYATAVTAPEAPTKTGYTFAGWDVKIPETMPAGDMTITAKWTINQYTITFDTAGGTATSPITQDYGTDVTAPEAPTKTGYTFAGWDQTIPTTMPAENVTITAKWTVNQYTITFADTGDKVIAPITQDYNSGITAPDAPTKTGYTFVGWDKEIPATMPAEDMTITAQWKINQYTITFNTDGGTAVAAIKQDYGTAVTAPADPTKTGYDFAGWDVKIPATMPAEDVTITAKWTINSYTITFDTDGGSEIKPIKQDYATAVKAPEAPTKTGYTFAGWDQTIPTTMPAKDLTITAKWTINQYTITFDTAGGSAIAPITQNYGTAVTAPGEPRKTGYTFAGWDVAIPATMPAENVTIKAKWTINQYTITFDTDGGSEIAPITQDYNTAVTAPANPTKTGYTFAGWDKAVPAKMPAEDRLLTARWTINRYTITFDTDGGSEIKPITQDYNTAVTAPANPTKTGYTFAGWDVEIPATMPAENVTIKAQWTVNQYTITFNTDGGSAIAPITQDYATAVTAPTAPTKTGYTFAGWDVEIPATMPAENVTITAKWNINYYTITFKNEDGTTLQSGEVAYGTVPAYTGATPTKAATAQYTYTFAGWSPAIAAVTGEATYTATYTSTVNGYTITFEAPGAEGTMAPMEQKYGDTVSLNSNAFHKYGHDFDGWLGSDGKTYADAATVTVTGNLTLTAQWKRSAYTVIWNVDGNQDNKVPYQYGDTIVAPADPQKTGYEFTGWTGFTEGMTMPAQSQEFYAQWTPIVYDIKLDTDGDGILEKTIRAPYDGALALEDGVKMADNTNTYTFLGWSTEPGGEVLENLPAVSGEASYYAVFEAVPITYTITLHTQGGAELTALTGGYEAKVTLPEATGKTGYTFVGWAETTDPNAATMAAGSEFTILTNDDLYAVWQINTYNLTWIVDGVETVVPYEYGAAVAPVAKPEKEGHTFTGWDTEIPEYMPANDVTITAIFEINTYTIGWDTNEDGEADVTDTVNWNVVPVYDAEKHGAITKESTVDTVYTFSGWTVEPVAATDNVVYTAKFDSAVRQYTITWVVDGVESTTSVAYGQTPVAPEATKAEDNYNTYAFSSWNTAEDGTGTGIETVIGEATYYALFTSTAKVYTLTLDLDGGHIGEQNVLIFEGGYGDAIEAPATDPEKTGYTFMGWSEEIPAELTETKTITAQWKINQYTITFDTVGAGEIDAITQDYGTAIEAPADPTKVGHTFDGWAPALPTTMPAENMDLVAIWQVNQYSITFDTRGGTEISPITGDYGSAVDVPADPQRAGYTFLGWDAEIPATIPAEDVVLTAVWEANENKIELYTEKGGSLYASIVAKTDENVADQLPADPTKEGHTFGGWVDANGEPYALSDIMPTSSLVLYAKWNVSEYTITFDLGGGMIGDQTTYTIVQDFETEVTAPADPVRAGYTFQGWFVKGADGSEYGYQIPETMPAKNETVFAKWSANRYTVTYQDDAGNVLFTQTLYCDEVITVPTITRKGYTFVGWQDTIPGVMPAGDLVLTSIWTVNQYTITFIADGGSEVEAIVADYGAVLTAPEAPTKEGYTFQGWSPEMPETMPAQNLTLTAQWALSEYTVTWLNHDGSELAKDIVKHGELPVYQGAEPVRAETPELSYTFSGWTPEVVEATGNATYTAVYEETRKAYTVTFLFENGQENLVITVVNGDAIEIPAAPEKDGYVFNGWNPAVPETMPAENITATAQWVKEVYTITFDPDNGMEPVDVTTGWGESYSKPADPVKEGYTFAGWANAEGEIVELPAVMPEENLELKASWTVNRYTITFNTDGGSEIEAITLDYGAVVTAPAAPEKDGYTFMGWTPALPETMPATDLAVTAQWKWTYTGWFDEDAGTTYLIDGQKAYFGQWKEIEGTTYYFDDQSYIVSDLYTTTAPDGSHVGIFVFDESGKFLADKTGVHISNAGDTYWVESGEVILDKGLTRVVLADGEVNYYFFGEDGKAAKDTILWVEKTNGYLVKWDYTFDANGVIIHHEDTSRMGVHEDENGVECYYIDGVKVHWGLFQIGENYYYARSDGALVKNKTYWISVTNGLLEEGAYKFDEQGRIVIEPVKDGIYAEDGSLYYYEDGLRTYRGLFEGDGIVGEDGCYYYANTRGEIINGCRYWITKTNGLLVEGSYDFDEKGCIVLEGKYTGFVEESDGIYYYLDGVKTYAGLIYVDGYYYYVNASCKLIVGRSYWVTRTNGLLAEGSYTFDAQGRIILEAQDDSVVKNGIVEENGVKYYYVDGVKTFAGLIVIDGDYYYVNSSCKVVVGRSYWITKTNGLMPEGSYTFDADGKMIL